MLNSNFYSQYTPRILGILRIVTGFLFCNTVLQSYWDTAYPHV